MTTKELYKYAGTVKRCVDGDTCLILVDLGMKVYKLVDVRLARINAPELTSKDPAIHLKATESRDFLDSTLTGKDILMSSTLLDKYGRSIAEIWIDGVNVNDLVVQKGFAVNQKY